MALGTATLHWVPGLDAPPWGPPVPPQVQPGPRVLKVLAGEALDLNCAATGDPEPQLSWSKNGMALQGGRPEGSVYFKAIEPSDAGTYRCEASNSAGVDAWELELRVLGECPQPSPPTAAWTAEVLTSVLVQDLSHLGPPSPAAVGPLSAPGYQPVAPWAPDPETVACGLKSLVYRVPRGQGSGSRCLNQLSRLPAKQCRLFFSPAKWVQ
jgi:hypothetical protein